MRWYISATAVKRYMAIMGYEGSPDGPIFDRAAIELEDLCEQAHRVEGANTESGAQKWRVKTSKPAAHGKATRLELTVAPDPRPEGKLPQLIDVRDKGRRGTHGAKRGRHGG